MATNKFLPLEQFTFIITPPVSRADSLCVNLYTDGKFNLNGKLAAALRNKPIQVLFTDDAKHLCLVERASPEAIIFPKSGSKRLEQAIHHLKARKIPLPAKYEVHYSDVHKFWQGDLVENPTQEKTQRGSGSKMKS